MSNPLLSDPVAEATKAERQRVSAILDLCTQAGKPNEATAFIEDGVSANDVARQLGINGQSFAVGSDDVIAPSQSTAIV